MSTPVIVDADISWLLALPKPISDQNWRDRLVPPGPTDLVGRGRFDLDDLPAGSPLGGTLHLYSRQNLDPSVVGDWSVGLVYTDYAGNSYRVLRCNGPHPTDHVNRIEGDVIVRQPHIHRLTERYQGLARGKPDGYAEVATEYSTLDEAVGVIVEAVNLTPSGLLFL